MQGISFSSINTKTFNTILCVVLPLFVLVGLSQYIPALMSNFSVKWLLSLQFLQLITIIACYVVPLTYFLSKAYELADFNNEDSWGNTILGFTACCVALLPLGFIALVMLAKLSFFIPIAFTVGIIFIYFRSLKATKVTPVS